MIVKLMQQIIFKKKPVRILHYTEEYDSLFNNYEIIIIIMEDNNYHAF